MKKKPIKTILLGAAGREFHNFNIIYRNNPTYEVVAFTAAQIPNIANRVYPPKLSGKLYPSGIPVFEEKDLETLIKEKNVDEVVFSYSDVSHEHVMHKASIANAAGADFRLIGAEKTMLKSKKPVISVCAVRTGCGKSQTTRQVCKLLKYFGKKLVVVRHPMPYGNLEKQVCQRFENLSDLKKYECTVEEIEDYEPHIENGVVVYAGIDYKKILRKAEKEADVIIWDGGNNDTPFFKPNLEIVVLDPHRAGHELKYFPGETNLRRADIAIINKIDSAKEEDIALVEKNIREANPKARIVKAKSEIFVENSSMIEGKKVLVIEDGPTVTHGGMAFGAAFVAAERYKAKEIINPKQYAVGSIKETFESYKHLEKVLPAVGYSEKQVKELEATINAAECDLVISGTPTNLNRIIKANKPILRVRYELNEDCLDLEIAQFVAKNL